MHSERSRSLTSTAWCDVWRVEQPGYLLQGLVKSHIHDFLCFTLCTAFFLVNMSLIPC